MNDALCNLPTINGLKPRIGLLTGWLSRNNGGVFEAVVEQAALIASIGAKPVAIGLADDLSDKDRARLVDTDVFACPSYGPKVLGYSPGLAGALKEAKIDLLHLHGIWMYASHAGSQWAARTGKPYIISPHGMLDSWIMSRGKMKKAIGRIGYENANWRRASRFHALTEDEAADIRSVTGSDRIDVVPNAIRPNEAKREATAPTVLYLGRIHPKKNVEALVRAWGMAKAAVEKAGARLIIAGWGAEEDVASLESCLSAAQDPSIDFVGPVYGPEKAQLMADARYLCLPSFSEGLPMAILEAWASGTPTLMTSHCHLGLGFDEHAALDCGTEVSDIAACLGNALATDDREWSVMSDNARRLADKQFSHTVIRSRWSEVYGSMLKMQKDASHRAAA